MLPHKTKKPDEFVRQIYKNQFRKFLKQFILELVLMTMGCVILALVFGSESLLKMIYLIAIMGGVLLIRFLYRMVTNSKYRKSFLNFLSFTDDDSE